MINLRRTLAIAACEARLLRRDPLLFVRAVGVPVALLFTLGYGLSFDVEHIPFAVVDYDQSATSREYVYAFAGIRAFDLRTASASEAEVETMLRRGAIRLAIIIPSDFERTLYRGLPSRVQLLVDGVYPYRAEVTRGYALACMPTWRPRSGPHACASERERSSISNPSRCAPATSTTRICAPRTRSCPACSP